MGFPKLYLLPLRLGETLDQLADDPLALTVAVNLRVATPRESSRRSKFPAADSGTEGDAASSSHRRFYLGGVKEGDALLDRGPECRLDAVERQGFVVALVAPDRIISPRPGPHTNLRRGNPLGTLAKHGRRNDFGAGR